MLGTAPGTTRLNDWVNRVDDGMSLTELANHIAGSNAFQATYPAFMTNAEFAEAFLGNLMGNEEVPAALVALAVTEVTGLLNGGMSRGELALAAVHAMFQIHEQGEDHPAHGDLGGVAALLANRTAVAEHYTLEGGHEYPSADVLASVTSDPASVAMAIRNIDNPPADAVFDEVGELSIHENMTEGVVGSVTATDPNTTDDHVEAVTYSLAEGSHEGFSINPDTGEISYAGEGLDHETTPTIDLTVIATSMGADGTPTGVEKTVTVMVGDVQENSAVFGEVGPLTLAEHADGSGMMGDDNAPITVGDVTASDADGDMITYSIKDAPDGWEILDDGKLRYIGTGIDFEEHQSVDLTIVASSFGASGAVEHVEKNVTVMIQDQNDAIWGDSELMSLNELTSGADTAISLGNLVATDADGDAVTYGMVGAHAEGDDGVLFPGFKIDASTGAISYNGPGIRHTTTESVDLNVTATSIGDDGTETMIEQTVTINIQARADAVFESAELVLSENADGSGDNDPINVGNVVFSDANGDAITYSLAKDTDEDWMIQADGKLRYLGEGIDFETTESVSLTVIATSIGANGEDTHVEQEVMVQIHNVPDNPIAGVSDELTGEATLRAGTNTADTLTGYSFVIDDADGDAGDYSVQVFEGDDEGVSTKFKAMQDADNPRIFHIVAIAGAQVDSGDYNLTVVATDGSMDEDGDPNTATATYEVEVLRADRPDPGAAENTFHLTTGIDVLVGTNQNDLFVALTTVDEGADRATTPAPEPTLTALDDIDGGGGYDILQLRYELGDTENISWADSVRVSNVEEVQIETTGNFGTGALGSGTAVSMDGWDLERVKLGIVEGTVTFDAGGAVVTNDDTLGAAVQIANADTVELTKVANTANVNIASGKETSLVDITGGAAIVISANGDAEGTHSTTVEDVYLDGNVTDVRAEDTRTVNIRSNVIDRLNLSNSAANVTVNNSATAAVDLEVTVDKYGLGPLPAGPGGTPDAFGGDRAVLTLIDTGSAATVDLIVEGDSYMGITAGNANTATKHLDISGGNKLDLEFTDDTELLETVVVTGSVALTMDVSQNNNLKTYNGSGGSGKQKLTIGDNNDALTAVSTGSGDDMVNIGATTDKLKTVNSGGGNDDLTVAIGPMLESIMTGSGKDTLTVSGTPRDAGVRMDMGSGDDTFNAIALNGNSRVMGGSGTDVLATTTSAAVETLDAGNVDSIYSGFEILDVTGSTNADSYDLDDIEIHRIQIKGGTTTSVTLDNAQPRTSLTVIGGVGQDADVVYNLEGASNRNSDSITVNVEAAGGRTDRPDDPDTTGTDENQATGNADLDLTANNVETITINSTVTPGGTQVASAYENVVSITAPQMTTLRVIGNGKVNVDTVPDSVKSVDTSGNSGGATVDASGATNAVTFTGGSAGENFTGGGQGDTLNGNGGDDMLTGGEGADILRGGAGKDIIAGDTGADTITGGAGADILTGGDQNDTFHYASSSDSRIVSFTDAGAATGIDVIADYASGDAITLSRGIGITEDEVEGPTARLDKGAVATTLKAFVGDGADFFEGSDGADRDVASATGTVGADNGTFMFFDSNGNGNLDIGSDLVIFFVGTAITTGNLEDIFDIV